MFVVIIVNMIPLQLVVAFNSTHDYQNKGVTVVLVQALVQVPVRVHKYADDMIPGTELSMRYAAPTTDINSHQSPQYRPKQRSHHQVEGALASRSACISVCCCATCTLNTSYPCICTIYKCRVSHASDHESGSATRTPAPHVSNSVNRSTRAQHYHATHTLACALYHQLSVVYTREKWGGTSDMVSVDRPDATHHWL